MVGTQFGPRILYDPEPGDPFGTESMKKAPLLPRQHFFVCCNRRPGSPLGPGCGDRGDAVYAALKRRVQERGETVTTWVTVTGCLGICPAKGATVAIYPRGAIATEVVPDDVDGLYDVASGKTDAWNPRKD